MFYGFAAAALYCFCRFPESRKYFAWAAGVAVGLGALTLVVGYVSGW